ncbi:TetR/AcrR family transcriptional regulator [Listeria cossartiae]|uniref:TetR/AcrR family transcriptional regulator n=1 Tax=Listeria cossartiae TaxID=2838249 RepID=UPI00162685FE|nr:TetR/AcrR family transcriptional regulator [Listeria cossartiae]MBC1544939.1 TetR/AcrR family transcriptional regulator [Listeria cossartiae subsp. cossartiae]
MDENRQAMLSKKWIIEALLDLLKTKPYASITITEITKKAGVARLTFYRNFDNKEEILLTRSNYLFQEYFNEIQKSGGMIDIKNALLQCFTYWKRDTEVMELLIKNNLIYLLDQPFYSFLEKIMEEVPAIKGLNEIQKTFILGGLTRTMLQWISTKNTDSPKQVTASILKLLDLEHLTN